MGGKQVWLRKRNIRDPCGNGIPLHLDCIDGNTILFSAFLLFSSFLLLQEAVVES